MALHLPSPTHAIRRALRVAPARPDFASGLRAGVITVLPLVLLPLVGRPELVWSSFAGWVAVLADKGGAYRTRARSIATVTVLGSVAAMLGGLVAPDPVVTVLVVAGGAALCGYARSLGAEASAIGTGVAIILMLAVARPVGGVETALVRGGFILLGGAWALFVALVLWPIRVFEPYRRMTAAVLRELAAYAEALAAERSLDGEAWHVRRGMIVARVRSAIETARAGLGNFRRGRPGPSLRGELLLVTIETADQLFGTLTAIGEALSLEPSAALRARVRPLPGVLRQVADRLESRHAAPVPTWGEDDSFEANTSSSSLEALLDAEVQTIVQAARELEGRGSGEANELTERIRPTPRVKRLQWLELASDVRLASASSRHALRTALGTAVALGAGRALHVGHEYWAALTAFVILQPSGAATFTRALQRVAGTVVGASFAAAVIALTHDSQVMLLVVFASIALGIALLPLNYGLFAVFVTPGFVLLAATSSAENDLPWARVVNTLVGCGLALVFSVAFLPTPDRDLLPRQLATVLEELRRLLHAVLEAEQEDEVVTKARQGVGVALVDAETSFQRLVNDAPPGAHEQEALLSILTYGHRIAATLISISLSGVVCGAASRSRAMVLSRVLADLTEALGQRRPPLPRPVPERGPALDPIARRRFERLEQQVAVVHAAVTRWVHLRTT